MKKFHKLKPTKNKLRPTKQKFYILRPTKNRIDWLTTGNETHAELQAIDPRRSQEPEKGCGFVAAESEWGWHVWLRELDGDLFLGLDREEVQGVAGEGDEWLIGFGVTHGHGKQTK